MIAAERALLGGWRSGELAVTHEDNAEGPDQLTVAEGLGLVGPRVEVHAARWGTVPRLVAAISEGLVAAGIALDENTVLILDPAADVDGNSATGSTGAAGSAPVRPAGAGHLWWARRGARGAATVTCRPAGGR